MLTAIEYTAIVFAVFYVVLAIRSNIWCWPVGIISSLLYIYFNIFYHLYQDAILQTYYVLAGFYGWYHWHRKNLKEEENFLSYSLNQNAKLILFGALLVPVFGYIFSKFGNSLSYYDATVTIFSFIATWMTAKKIVENWLFWVVIDLIASVMYFIKGAHPTAGLYLFYTLMAAYGYFEWRKQMKMVSSE